MILSTNVLISRIETKVRHARLSDAPFIVNANVCLALETEGKRLSLDCVTAGVKALLSARHAYERLGLKQTDYQVFEMDFRLKA